MSAELHPSNTGQGMSLAEPLRQPGRSRSSTHPASCCAARKADRACCCSARPAVVASMPPAPGRPHQTDLLLCGHHYRVSREALIAAGAAVVDMAGNPLGPETWPGGRDYS
ncbi:MAG TPA: hypothetical protein DHU96_17645 [Actinobacteria bacterium]|nr:hypothetical protein [Actinomycetota bacterium]